MPPWSIHFPSQQLNVTRSSGIYWLSSPFVLILVLLIHVEGLQKENSSFWAWVSVGWDDWWMRVFAGNNNGMFWFRSLWENRGTLAFMTEDLERKPHRREREGETVQFRDGHRGSSCLHAYPYKAPSLDDIFQSIRYSVVDWWCVFTGISLRAISDFRILVTTELSRAIILVKINSNEITTSKAPPVCQLYKSFFSRTSVFIKSFYFV